MKNMHCDILAKMYIFLRKPKENKKKPPKIHFQQGF
jgi:hypothetical protein